MSKRNDQTLLRDIIDAGRAAVNEIEKDELSDLMNDHVRSLGLIKCIEIIGEAVSRLSPRFRDSHGTIPWGLIIGMRNRLIHAYFDIDYEQVWKALTEDLPPLLQALEQILNNEFDTE